MKLTTMCIKLMSKHTCSIVTSAAALKSPLSQLNIETMRTLALSQRALEQGSDPLRTAPSSWEKHDGKDFRTA